MYIRLKGQPTCMGTLAFSDVASAACANKPDPSRWHQGTIILRLRSAVRTCRGHAIGFFSGMLMLVMHMRVAHKLGILELQDQTQAIELWASTVPEWVHEM